MVEDVIFKLFLLICFDTLFHFALRLNMKEILRILQSRLQESSLEVVPIGKGSYGNIYLVENKLTRQKSVLKRICIEHLSEREKRKSVDEALILSRLDHP
jgi:hypothetical protein